MKENTEAKYIEIVAAYAGGQTMEQIAATRGMAKKTVEHAIARMRRKYNAIHTTQLVVKLIVVGELEVAPTTEHMPQVQESLFGSPPERACRICGCTDHDCRQCIAKTGHPCHWVEEDLCSACAGRVVKD